MPLLCSHYDNIFLSFLFMQWFKWNQLRGYFFQPSRRFISIQKVPSVFVSAISAIHQIWRMVGRRLKQKYSRNRNPSWMAVFCIFFSHLKMVSWCPFKIICNFRNLYGLSSIWWSLLLWLDNKRPFCTIEIENFRFLCLHWNHRLSLTQHFCHLLDFPYRSQH